MNFVRSSENDYEIDDSKERPCAKIPFNSDALNDSYNFSESKPIKNDQTTIIVDINESDDEFESKNESFPKHEPTKPYIPSHILENTLRI